MKILIVTQYFYPESFRVNDLALGLKEAGHEVTIFTGKPNYPLGKFANGYAMFGKAKETWNGITVHRVPLIPRGNSGGFRLMLNYLSFAFFASLRMLTFNEKPDIIFVYQLSPITVAIPAIILKWRIKAKLILYIQDLWPQSVVAVNGTSSKLIFKVLEKLTNWVYKSSDQILIQSRAFKEYIMQDNIQEDKIKYLPNSTEKFYKRMEKGGKYSDFFHDGINIVFAGNIGEAQSFDTIIDAAKIVAQQTNEVRWVIIGDGRKKSYVEERIKNEDLNHLFVFTGSYAPEEMSYFFAHADALLVSLKREFIFSLTIPSKIQSYLACEKPIIGSLDGEGKKIIEESNCGLTAPAEDSIELANQVIRFKDMSIIERKTMGANGLSYYNSEFNRDMLINRLIDYLNKD